MTRKIKAKKSFWLVEVKFRGRKTSKGLWAPAKVINEAKAEVEKNRSTDAYKKKMASAKKSRDKKQREYKLDFIKAVRKFLSFDKIYKDMENKLARAVTEHAIPVGSGTVARTEMIPINERASRAVIAWMRHQTTAYDSLKIPRIKGKRREVRRMLAEKSSQLLDDYRKGKKAKTGCPLRAALLKIEKNTKK